MEKENTSFNRTPAPSAISAPDYASREPQFAVQNWYEYTSVVKHVLVGQSLSSSLSAILDSSSSAASVWGEVPSLYESSARGRFVHDMISARPRPVILEAKSNLVARVQRALRKPDVQRWIQGIEKHHSSDNRK